MNEIPKSVMEAAQRAIINATQKKRIMAVAVAIMEERERCAKICDSRMYDFGCISGTKAQDYVTLCADLASEIRGKTAVDM